MSCNIELIQDLLDVKSKTRANLFNWRGQFTPQFVDYILESFAKSDDVVVDPFAGSGTVLLECAQKDISCFGFEINPSAYAMSQFFSLCNFEFQKRTLLLKSIEEKLLNIIPLFEGKPLYIQADSYRENYRHLLEFTTALFQQLITSQEKIIALNILFICENGNKKNDLDLTIKSSFDYIANALLSLPFTKKAISSFLCDARLVNQKSPVKANLILTSPPYINVFNYHQNYRAIVETVGWNVLEVAHSEFGSNRKNRCNRFKTVVQYCFDMEQSFKSFWGLLENGGIVVMVIGKESNVRRVPFYNGKIVKDIVEGIGGFEQLASYQRTFTNKFGNDIKEDVLVLEKKSCPPTSSKAKDIALKHLNLALSNSKQDVNQEITDVLNNIEKINSSPLFNYEGSIF